MSSPRLVLSLLLSPVVPLALAGQVPADLTRAGHLRDRAIQVGDGVAWGQFTASEFTVVDQTGRLLTRADQLVQIRSVRGVELASRPLIYIDGIRVDGVAEAGESSACSGLNFVLFANGNGATRRCFTTAGLKLEVWTKTDSGWQAIAAQYSPAS